MSGQDALRQDVLAALDEVIDPELDRSVVELGFARADVEDDGQVTVEFRLPTYWCAPNFAYMMAQDALEAVRAVPGVRTVKVDLLEHFASQEVTEGMAGDRSFDDSFTGLGDGSGLSALRRLFWAKSFMIHQEKLARRLLTAGLSPADLTAMRLADFDHDDVDVRVYVEKRARLALPVDGEAPLVVYPNGHPIDPDQLVAYLDRCRLARVSMETNVALCQSLHATRYAETTEVAR